MARPVKSNARKSVAELEYVDGKLPLPAPRSILAARPSLSSVASDSSLGSVESSRRPRSSLHKRCTRVGENATFTMESMPNLDSTEPPRAPPRKGTYTSGFDCRSPADRDPSTSTFDPHSFEGLQGLAAKQTGNREEYTLDALDLQMLKGFWEECCSKCGNLKNAFNQLDVELNARIRKREFKTVGNAEHLNCKWLREHFAHIFWLLDSNEDGILRFDEFNGERLKLGTPSSPGAN